jgi:hypothetical protein
MIGAYELGALQPLLLIVVTVSDNYILVERTLD